MATAAELAEIVAKSGPELFRELLRHYSEAEVDDYYKNGIWKDDDLRADLQLVIQHRKEAGADDPPPVDEVKMPELPASAMVLGNGFGIVAGSVAPKVTPVVKLNNGAPTPAAAAAATTQEKENKFPASKILTPVAPAAAASVRPTVVAGKGASGPTTVPATVPASGKGAAVAATPVGGEKRPIVLPGMDAAKRPRLTPVQPATRPPVVVPSGGANAAGAVRVTPPATPLGARPNVVAPTRPAGAAGGVRVVKAPGGW
eukprot:TRINITY_DN8107_c0_g1_i1.p1 TRINITY_DN8107_c0_g1~~TRINITY_DN8107_c0_g1_i1.p1  ORF type:complete len:258 (-),score=66.67 TRINITY_DN8107_c0_g1_i1:269-1042(-)